MFKRTTLLAALAACFVIHGRANAQLLWHGDPAKGFDVFEGLEDWTGTGSVVSDPAGRFGRVFRMHLVDADGKDRVEVKGFRVNGENLRMAYGQEYYLGWRSRWNNIEPFPPRTWIAFFQIHGYGGSGCGAPLVLRTTGDNKLHLQYDPPQDNTESVHIWSIPFQPGEWHSYVLHFRTTRVPSEAMLEFWYDGVKQTFINNRTVYPAMVWDKEACPFIRQKWGLYRSGGHDGGGGDAYLVDARLARSYQDAAPPGTGGGGGGTIGVGVTQAEALKLTNASVEAGFNGQTVVKPRSSTSLGSIGGAFSGSSGVYDVTVRYFDENDGRAGITLRVGGTSQGSLTFDDDDNAWHSWTVRGVPIAANDQVTVEGMRSSGEHCRVDRIEITP